MGKFCIHVEICMGLVFWEVSSMEVSSGFVLLYYDERVGDVGCYIVRGGMVRLGVAWACWRG